MLIGKTKSSSLYIWHQHHVLYIYIPRTFMLHSFLVTQCKLLTSSHTHTRHFTTQKTTKRGVCQIILHHQYDFSLDQIWCHELHLDIWIAFIDGMWHVNIEMSIISLAGQWIWDYDCMPSSVHWTFAPISAWLCVPVRMSVELHVWR